MNDIRPLVSIVDDDESIRGSLPDLLRFFGFSVATFASANDFLASNTTGDTQCLILDIVMPEMTGPELYRELSMRGTPLPTIFMTAIRDDATRTRLTKLGSVDCLYKPFSDESIHEAVKTALRRSESATEPTRGHNKARDLRLTKVDRAALGFTVRQRFKAK